MAAGGTLGIQANGQTIALNITNEAGAAASVKVSGSPISFPYTFSTDTTFAITTGGTYTVSAIIDGVETYGKLLTFKGGDSEVIAPTPTREQLAAASTSGTSAVRRAGGTSSVWAALPYYNVIDYGAVPDGVTDSSAAIQAADTACQVHAFFTGLGGTIAYPEGKYYVATGITSTHAGTRHLGLGTSGISDDLSTGSVQIIAGDGQWGLTVGTDGVSDFRGFNVKGLHLFEKNAGQALGGLRILSSSNGLYEGVGVGEFTAGKGVLLDGHDGSTQAQYNTFIDCRFGKSLVGMENKFANGTRLIGCYFEGSHNGQTPTASTVGLKLTSGDTFRSFGTVFQGFDTLVSVAGVYNPEFYGARFEVWTTAAVSVASGCTKGKFYGDGDNSLASNSGIGAVIASGAADIEMGVTFRNVKTLYSDNGTRTRYPGRAGPAKGAAVVGNVSGQFAQYDPSGNLIGYAPLYDSITGIYQIQKLGGTVIDNTGQTTVTRTLTAPANVGDLVIIGGGYGSGSTVTVTVTDTRSNTWTTNRHDDLTTGATPHSFIASSVLTTALQVGDVLTATFSAGVSRPMIFGYDNAGQIAGSVVDVAGGATGTGTAVSSGNITTTTDYPYLFSAVYFDQAATLTAGTGFTVQDTQTSTSKTLATETMNGPQAGTFVGATATLSSSVDWATSVVAFKKVAGGAAPTLPTQTGNSGKFLTTNGTSASWGTPSAGSLTSGSNYLAADVTMTTNGTYYDGPTLTLGAGTYLLTGSIQVSASTAASRTWGAKLWDGTTAISSGAHIVTGSATAGMVTIYVSGLVSPGGSTTYKISATSTVNADVIKGTGVLGSYLNYVKIA